MIFDDSLLFLRHHSHRHDCLNILLEVCNYYSVNLRIDSTKMVAADSIDVARTTTVIAIEDMRIKLILLISEVEIIILADVVAISIDSMLCMACYPDILLKDFIRCLHQNYHLFLFHRSEVLVHFLFLHHLPWDLRIILLILFKLKQMRSLFY